MACGSESSAHSILLHVQGSLLEDRAWGWSSTLQYVLASGNTWRGWPSMALTVHRTRHCWGQDLDLVGGERLCDCSSMNGAPPIREGGSTVHWVQGVPVSECLWPWIAKPSF